MKARMCSGSHGDEDVKGPEGMCGGRNIGNKIEAGCGRKGKVGGNRKSGGYGNH